MDEKLNDAPETGSEPKAAAPRKGSWDEILKHIWPAPDEETERFVAEIYADRRRDAGDSSPE